MAKRRMETLSSGKFEFLVAEKIVNKAVIGLKHAKSAFFIANLFDESKKKLHHMHLKGARSSVEHAHSGRET